MVPRLALLLALLAPSPLRALPDEPIPTPAEVLAEQARLRAEASQARPSAGYGMFIPYDEVAGAMTRFDALKKAAMGVFVCVQVQALSDRGAFHLERARTLRLLARRDAEAARQRCLDEIVIGKHPAQAAEVRAGQEARRRAYVHRLDVRGVALERLSAREGAAVSGVDYVLLSSPCPPPPACASGM